MELAVCAAVFAAVGDLWGQLWSGAGGAEGGRSDGGGGERGDGLCFVRWGCVVVGAEEFWRAWTREEVRVFLGFFWEGWRSVCIGLI